MISDGFFDEILDMKTSIELADCYREEMPDADSIKALSPNFHAHKTPANPLIIIIQTRYSPPDPNPPPP